MQLHEQYYLERDWGIHGTLNGLLFRHVSDRLIVICQHKLPTVLLRNMRSADYDVARCLSVTRRYCVETAKLIKLFCRVATQL